MTATTTKTVAQILKAFEKAENAATKSRDEKVATAQAEFAAEMLNAENVRNAELFEAARAHFEKGKTLEQFAKLYGKSVPTTRNHLKELGVEVPAGKRGVKSKYTEVEQKAIAQEWKDGTTRQRLQLALKKDVTEATMRNWAIEHGIYEPKKREAKAEAETVEAPAEVETVAEAPAEELANA